MIFHHVAKSVLGFMGSRYLQETAGIPSERASKTMGIQIENEKNDELHGKLWMIKGGPGTQTGGWGSRQSGGPLSPGGECFAPHSKTYIMTPRYFLDHPELILRTSIFHFEKPGIHPVLNDKRPLWN